VVFLSVFSTVFYPIMSLHQDAAISLMKSRGFTILFTGFLILVLVYSIGRFLNRQRVADSHEEILAIIQLAMETKSAAPIINEADDQLFTTVDADTYYELFRALERAGELESINNINYEVSSSHWWPWVADLTVNYHLTAQYSRGSTDATITVVWKEGDWGFTQVELAIHSAIANLFTIPAAQSSQAS